MIQSKNLQHVFTAMGLLELPPELLLRVAGLLSPWDLANLRTVCHHLHDFAADSMLWSAAIDHHFSAFPSIHEQMQRAIADGISPLEVFASMSIRVHGVGSNRGPGDWGVPSAPPHPDFGQTGAANIDEEDTDSALRALKIFRSPRLLVKQVNRPGFCGLSAVRYRAAATTVPCLQLMALHGPLGLGHLVKLGSAIGSLQAQQPRSLYLTRCQSVRYIHPCSPLPGVMSISVELHIASQ